MAATEKSITAGLLTFVFYGLLPCALLLWLLGVKHRRHQHNKQLVDEVTHQEDATDAKSDE